MRTPMGLPARPKTALPTLPALVISLVLTLGIGVLIVIIATTPDQSRVSLGGVGSGERIPRGPDQYARPMDLLREYAYMTGQIDQISGTNQFKRVNELFDESQYQRETEQLTAAYIDGARAYLSGDIRVAFDKRDFYWTRSPWDNAQEDQYFFSDYESYIEVVTAIARDYPALSENLSRMR
jgi:hypothetical protein